VTPGVQKLDQRVETLLARLRRAAVTDRAMERRTKVFLALAIVTGLAAAGCLVVACGMAVEAHGATERASATRLALLGAVALALCLVFSAWYRAWKRLDLDNRKLQALLRLLAILRADIRHTERVRVSADLRDTEQGGELLGRERVGASKVSRYRHAWLTLSARLADGNTVDLTVVDHLKVKQKKRTRYVRTTDVDLALRLDKRYRGAVPALVDLLERRTPPHAVPAGAVAPPPAQGGPARESFRLTGVRAAPSGSAVKVALRTPRLEDQTRLPDGDVLLGVVRWVYGMLAEARPPA
jgi:hypothetical protein